VAQLVELIPLVSVATAERRRDEKIRGYRFRFFAVPVISSRFGWRE